MSDDHGTEDVDIDIPEDLPGRVADALDTAAQTPEPKTPGTAAYAAEAALHLFLRHPDDPAHLHAALRHVVAGLKLLARGQSQLAKDVADLNITAGDLDTSADPIAPPPPGVVRPARAPVTAKTSARAAANAAKKLQPHA